MLAKSNGIVLHTVKFGEKSLVVTLYTREWGRQAYLMNASRGAAARNKAVIMQPLFIVEVDGYMRKTREIQRIKECRLAHPYATLPYDIRKSTQAIFLAELLFRVLQEQESNCALYDFVEESLLFFDRMESGISWFHLWFMVHLTGFMGILPNLEDKGGTWFDLRKGTLVSPKPPAGEGMDSGTTRLLQELTGMKIGDLSGARLNSGCRKMLLYNLISYYQIHFESMGAMHSHEVLKEVFE